MGVMAGAKAAVVATVAAAVPTLASVRMLPWAKTNLNPTAQALIISTAAGMAYFIVADKTIGRLHRPPPIQSLFLSPFTYPEESVSNSNLKSPPITNKQTKNRRRSEIIQEKRMDTSRRQSGIQQLLAAEQEAQQIVNAARNAKMARLRQAKEEAEREITAYRAQMEAEFQKKVAESSGDSGANVKRLEQETEEKIANLKQQAAAISPDVVSMLLRHVTSVKN
ncbi:V-type proton ATPase subunit G [Rhynchospora pubera]|uniref:V-type proton ATPase subunit G n=1 Tax=Rhynchospora pubera TaxID=906938 RepID=A0AAV8HST4_9POAL|nr:V-type proton ATPase subunit G [Rhynchospora pubera]